MKRLRVRGFEKMELLEYEFWREEQKWYQKFLIRVFKNDLNSIRKEIAKRILQIKKKKINWLDIGTGNRLTLLEILKYINQKGNFKINITIIEPSKYAIEPLKEKLDKLKNVNYKTINSKFDFKFINEKYDCIVLSHVNYYLAFSKNDFKELYKRLYNQLNQGGVLLVQTIADDSDFQIVGNPNYSKFALGYKTHEIFRELWRNVQFIKMPTRFEVTQYLEDNITKEIEKELLHLYRFVTQKNDAILTEKQLRKFILKIRKLAQYKGSKYFLDFKDCIVSIQKY